ncbi:MAG TPA: MerR family transcriptional regulator [Solirubrobacteraceae bacterium]|nr:MerR family transcriptional regulator [Solirubrobacteraceae bacterium]
MPGRAGVTHEGLHQIGEVASRLGLSLRTIRYYEELGLIGPTQRTEGGFRLYSDQDIDRLALIKHIKPLGLTMQAMLELLDARDTLADTGASPEATAAAMQTLERFAGEAAERVQVLRGQLAQAEQFAAQLRSELGRQRPSGIR